MQQDIEDNINNYQKQQQNQEIDNQYNEHRQPLQIYNLDEDQNFDSHNYRNSDNFYQYNQNDNHFIQTNQENYNIFTYEDDERRRQSIKYETQSDHQLEDISGNADISDKYINSNNHISQVQTKINNIQIQLQNINQHQKNNINNQQQQQKQNYNNNNNEKLQQEKTIQLKSKQTIIEQQQPQKQIQTLNINKQSQKQSQNKKQIQVFEQPDKNKQTQLINTQSKPQKIQKLPFKLQIKQQKTVQNEYVSPVKQKQQKNKQIYKTPIVEQTIKSQQKSRISFVKQNLISFKQSSIRDWFRLSNDKSNLTGQKQKQPTNISNISNNYSKSDKKQQSRQQLQKQMLQIQSSLNKHSKNSKNLFTQKQKQSNKLNKTHLPTSINYNKFINNNKKSKQQINEQNSKDQMRMLLKISFEKKKQNYNMLKQWDKKRAQTMALHRNIIQMIQNQVDKRIKASLQNFQIYLNFFKQKLKQQQKFVNSSVINTKYALQNNSISKNIYINCSVILNSLSQQNQLKCKKIQDFITLIKINILKDLIEQHLHQSQKQLLKVRQKISSLKNSLKKYNSETQQKSISLATYFSQSSNNISIKSQNDFYSVQLQFLRCACQQILIQKKLGQSCLQYYNASIIQQLKRSKVIKQALVTYSKGLKQTYNLQLEDVQLEQLSKEQQRKLIEQYYQLQDMIDQRSQQVFKNKFNIPLQHGLTIRQFNKYIQNFEFQNFNSRMLLLKQFNSRYYGSGIKQSSSSKSSYQQQQTCYIVITVDFYLHLFFSYEKPTQLMNMKPDISLKISSKQLEIRSQKQQFIDIVKKQQKRTSMISYFWEGKNQKVYRLRFNTKDSKQQFWDYINKLMF